MATIAGAESRGDLHRFDPNRLVIVTDPENVLCQEVRNRTPTPEWLVRSIMALGVTTPIQVRRGPKIDGEFTYEVVVGRQRVKAAREANKRLVKAGREPVLIKVEVVQGTDEDMLALIRSENVRVDMSPLERAETAQLSVSRGVSVTKVINDSFRGSKADYERHMALLACHPDVVAAIEDGRLAVKVVDTFTELTRGDQEVLLERMVAEGKTGPREAKNIAATAEETLENNGTGRPGEEPRTKNGGPPRLKLRKVEEIVARLAEMSPFDLDAWAEKNDVDLEGDGDDAMEPVLDDRFDIDARIGRALTKILPVQYRSEVETLLISSIRTARIEELDWVLRDDDALETASRHDLGGWEKPKDTKEEQAAERAARREAEKADKIAAKLADKEKAKADKIAVREKTKADKLAEKEKAKARAANDARQIPIEASIAPKVPGRKGRRGKK